MRPKFQIKTTIFSEHPICDYSQVEPDIYDISAIGLNCSPSFIINNQFSSDLYCSTLLKKIDELSKNCIDEFLDYQCSQIKKPNEWLDSIESLIESNSEYFTSECQCIKTQKLLVNIEFCRRKFKIKRKPLKNQLINWAEISSEENAVKFDFNMVKFDLAKLNSFNAKKAYLIELKADYLQSENMMTIISNKNFTNLIDIELDKIEKLQCIPEPNALFMPESTGQQNRFRINGNTNILVDIFYRLIYEFKPEGKPFIDATPSDIANLIVNNFINKEGENISLSSVKTILTPGKPDKRPSAHKRFSI